ncbi:MAG: hypothetical protein R3F01_01285 [Lysobacteraceae bacterium]
MLHTIIEADRGAVHASNAANHRRAPRRLWQPCKQWKMNGVRTESRGREVLSDHRRRLLRTRRAAELERNQPSGGGYHLLRREHQPTPPCKQLPGAHLLLPTTKPKKPRRSEAGFVRMNWHLFIGHVFFGSC